MRRFFTFGSMTALAGVACSLVLCLAFAPSVAEATPASSGSGSVGTPAAVLIDHQPAPAHPTSRTQLVGSWFAVTEGAPYAHHVLQFHADGTMLISNPSRVQESSDGTGTNDSLGVGAWKYDRGSYVFWFGEDNAVQGTSTPATPIIVAFRVWFHTDGSWAGSWASSGPTRHYGTIRSTYQVKALVNQFPPLVPVFDPKEK